MSRRGSRYHFVGGGGPNYHGSLTLTVPVDVRTALDLEQGIMVEWFWDEEERIAGFRVVAGRDEVGALDYTEKHGSPGLVMNGNGNELQKKLKMLAQRCESARKAGKKPRIVMNGGEPDVP